MQQVVSITSQGQVTIPKRIRTAFGLRGKAKAVVEKVGDEIIVRPRTDFWALAGSVKTDIKLTAKQLRKAREAFGKQWAKK